MTDDPVSRLAGHRVIVIGDLVLDEYLTGRPSRVSREAPVLVLDETHRESRAGSAGSPAANVVALGSRATIVGALGADPAGDRLRSHLAAAGIGVDGLVVATDMATSTKTRILAQGFTGGLFGRQQVLRVDRVSALPPDAERRCAERVQALAPAGDAIILSDYRGGVVSDAVLDAARATGLPIAVDSQGDPRRFHDVDLLKINQAEAHAALGTEDLLAAGDAYRRSLRVEVFAVTLGPDGMILFADEGIVRAPAIGATEVFDVTGAGDTVIAVLCLARLGGLPPRSAALLANAAASVVVRRLGVATATPDEIRAAAFG